MLKSHTTATTAFESFANSVSNNDLLHFGNEMLDKVFNFDKVTADDVNELKSALQQSCNNQHFNDFIIDIFGNDRLDTTALKTYFSSINLDQFPKIGYTNALSIMQDIYKMSNSTTIKQFISYLVFSVEDIYAKCDKIFVDAKMTNYTAFVHVVNEQIENIKSFVMPSAGSITLLSIICQHDDSPQLKSSKVKYISRNIDYSKCKSFNDVKSQATTIEQKVRGFVYDGSFKSAVKVMSLVAPVWDTMCASSLLRETNRPFSMTGGNSSYSKYSDGDVVSVFTGAYHLVSQDSNESTSGLDSTDSVFDHSAFNQLSNSQKRNVLKFLDVNRKRFNNILEQSTKTIINKLRTSLSNNNWKSALQRTNLAPQFATNFNYNSNSKVNNDVDNFMSKLTTKMSSKPISTFTDAISFIVHDYIPMANQFNHTCSDKHGFESAKYIMQKLNSTAGLDILGVGSDIVLQNKPIVSSFTGGWQPTQPSPMTFNSLTGGKKSTNSRPITPMHDNFSTENITYGGSTDANLDKVPKDATYGMKDSSGSSANKLLNAFVNGQKEFNRKYEDLYRKLTRELSNINVQSFEKSQYRDIYAACSQFDAIAIKNPKTTSYLSGFYGAKDYNKLYTQVVDTAIQTLRKLQIRAFDNVTSVLEEMKRLLIDTRAQMIKVKNQYIVAPKTSSEMFLVAAKDIKQDCDLNSKDFIALSDAISRLFAATKAVTSGTNSSLQQQLQKYVEDIFARETIIRNHYDENITAIRHRFINESSTAEANTTRDVLVGFEEQKREALLWLNKNLDQHLTKNRLEQLKNVVLSKEQLNLIESAYTTFKNSQATKDFQEDLRKIGKLITNANNGSVTTVYKLITKLRGIVKATQYFNFLSQLYDELKLMSGLNWRELEDTLVNLLIISSIDISEVQHFEGSSVNDSTFNECIYELSKRLEHFCQSRYIAKINRNWMLPIGSAASFVRFLMRDCKTEPGRVYGFKPTARTITEQGFGPINANGDITGHLLADNADQSTFVIDQIEDKSINELVKHLKSYQISETYTVVAFGPGVNPQPEDVNSIQALPWFNNPNASFADDNNNQSITFLELARRWVGAGGGVHAAYFNNVNNDEMKLRQLSLALGALDKIGAEFYTEKFVGVRPFYAEHPILFVDALIAASLSDADKVLLPIDAKKSHSGLYHYSFLQDTHHVNEIQLINNSFDALNANVLSVIDRYWGLRYNGNLDLPINLSTMLSGGDIQNGGTLFDNAPVGNINHGTVLPEAVPFYVCAFNVCVYYIKTFAKEQDITRNSGDEFNKYKLYLKVNKISTLYPVYKIFAKDEAELKSVTDAQMRTILAVFNNIWEQAEGGNEAQHLARAIDLLFGELNGCLLFSNKMQIEILKNHGKVSGSIVDVLKHNINEFVNTVKDTIVGSFKDRNNTLQQDEFTAFEHLLQDAMNRVKAEPDNRRVRTLQTILTNDSSVDNRFSDYYKFMELVVSPLLISAETYGKLLKLFDTYTFTVDSQGQLNNEIHLDRIKIAYQDLIAASENVLDPTNLNAAPHADSLIVNNTVWDLIREVVQRKKYHLKSILLENPVVLQYNRILLNKAFYDFHISGKFKLPNFWLAMDEHTYPQSPNLVVKIENGREYTKSDNILIFRQLWPNIRAKTVGDYYRHCINELRADYECCVHNFVAYPGISDKMAKHISDVSKDILKPNNLRETIDESPEVQQLIQKLDTVVVKDSSITPLPRLPNECYISKMFDPVAPCGDLNVTRQPLRINDLVHEERYNGSDTQHRHDLNNIKYRIIRLDGTDIYVVPSQQESLPNRNVVMCNYNWIDWVIFNLAKCDKTNYCLPYKLVNMLKSNSELANYLKPAFVTKNKITEYTLSQTGLYENLMTQNIMLRSESIQNKEKIDYSLMNSIWIAGLVAITPYLISTLVAVKDTVSEQATQYGRNVKRDVKYLIETLTVFYDDINNFTPFMPFMADSIQITSSKPKPHLIAELLSFIKNNSLNDMDVNDFIRIEWSNIDFFAELDGVTFATFKNKDKFEWLKSYAKDKLASSMFAVQFDSTLKTLARNTWACLIASDMNNGTNVKSANAEVDSLILDCINILSECEPQIIQKFVDRTVEYYQRNNNGQLMNSADRIVSDVDGNAPALHPLTGGNSGSNFGTDGNDEYKSIWSFLTNGLVNVRFDNVSTRGYDGQSVSTGNKVDFNYDGTFNLIKASEEPTDPNNTYHSPAVQIMADVTEYMKTNDPNTTKSINIKDLIYKLKTKISDFRNSNIVRDISNLINNIHFDNSWTYTKHIGSEAIKSYNDTIMGDTVNTFPAIVTGYDAQIKRLDNFVDGFNRIFKAHLDNLVGTYSAINIDQTIKYLRKVVNCDLKNKVYGDLFATLHYMYSYYRNFLVDVYAGFRECVTNAVLDAGIDGALAANINRRCAESAIFNGIAPAANTFVNDQNMFTNVMVSNGTNAAIISSNNAENHNGVKDPQIYNVDDLGRQIPAYYDNVRVTAFDELNTDDRQQIGYVTKESCNITNDSASQNVATFNNTQANINDIVVTDNVNVLPAAGNQLLPPQIYKTLDKLPKLNKQYANIAAVVADAGAVNGRYAATPGLDPEITNMLTNAPVGGGAGVRLISKFYNGTKTGAHAANNNHAYIIVSDMTNVINEIKQGNTYNDLSNVGLSNKILELTRLLTLIRDEYQNYFLQSFRNYVAGFINTVDNLSRTDPDNVTNRLHEMGYTAMTVNGLDTLYDNTVVLYIKAFDAVFKLFILNILLDKTTLQGDFHEYFNKNVDPNFIGHTFANDYNVFRNTINNIITNVNTKGRNNRILEIDFNINTVNNISNNVYQYLNNNPYDRLQFKVAGIQFGANAPELAVDSNIQPFYSNVNPTTNNNNANAFENLYNLMIYLNTTNGCLQSGRFVVNNGNSTIGCAIQNLNANATNGGVNFNTADFAAGNTIANTEAIKNIVRYIYALHNGVPAGYINDAATFANAAAATASRAAGAGLATNVANNILVNAAGANINNGAQTANGNNISLNLLYVLIDAIRYMKLNTLHTILQIIRPFFAHNIAPNLDYSANFANTILRDTHVPIVNGTNIRKILKYLHTVVSLNGVKNSFRIGRKPCLSSLIQDFNVIHTALTNNSVNGSALINMAVQNGAAAAVGVVGALTGGFNFGLIRGSSISTNDVCTKIFREARGAYEQTSAVHGFNNNDNFRLAIDKYVSCKLMQMFRSFDVFTKYIANPNILGLTQQPLFSGIGLFLHPQTLTDVSNNAGAAIHQFDRTNYGATDDPANTTGGQLANGVLMLHLMKTNFIYDYYIRNNLTNHKYMVLLHNLYILRRCLHIPDNTARDGHRFAEAVIKYGGLVFANPMSILNYLTGAAVPNWHNQNNIQNTNVFEIASNLTKLNIIDNNNIGVNENEPAHFAVGQPPVDVTQRVNGQFFNALPDTTNFDTPIPLIGCTLGSVLNGPPAVKNSTQQMLPVGLRGGAKHTKLPSMIGGFVDVARAIREIAVNVAQSPSTRAIYRDLTLTTSGIVPTAAVNVNATLPDQSFYLYKYLYNPRLLGNRNNTRYSDLEYVTLALGKLRKFIIDPLNSSTTVCNLDPAVFGTDLTHPYKNMFDQHPNQLATFYSNPSNPLVFNVDDPLYAKILNAGKNLNETLILNKQYSVIANQLSAKLNVATNGPLNVPAVQNGITNLQSAGISFNEVSHRPIHEIVLDEKLIANVPYTKVLETYLFSPQKDIYNATFVASNNTPRCATVAVGVDKVTETVQNTNTSYLVHPRLYELCAQCLTDDSYILDGAEPIVNVHNNTLNQDVRYNVLHRFIDALLSENAQYIFSYVKQNPNIGFDVGVETNKQMRLFGGAIKYKEPFANKFMNLESTLIGTTAKELIQQTYNLPTDKDTVYEDGRQLYCNLFKSFNFNLSGDDNYKLVFAYVADYFNKHTISFNAIYNQLCFTSIIYSSAVYKSYIPRFKVIFDNENINTINPNSYKRTYNVYDFIKIYLKNFTTESADGNLNAADLAENPDLQVLDPSYNVRSVDMTFKSLSETLLQIYPVNGQPDTDGNRVRSLLNQYTSPSVNSNVFSDLVNLLTYMPSDSRYKAPSQHALFVKKNYNEQDITQHCTDLFQLMPSGVMNSIRHFDVTATFIYTMFLWLKQTSFYDNKKDMDISYFNSSNVEPFSITGE